jgi:Mn-dependent DtxR family transcriptional regulator
MRESSVERSILVDILIFGDDKAGNISSRTGHPSASVSRSMGPLEDDGLLVDKGGGVYRLTESGRDMAQNIIRAGYNPYVSD